MLQGNTTLSKPHPHTPPFSPSVSNRPPIAHTQECDVCDAFCSSGLARAVKDVIKCTIDLPTLGITAAAHVSDAGQQIAYGHGAIRTKGRPYTPETGYLEQFDILVNNDVDRPRVNRDSVSCRRPHRESRTGAFVPGLDNNGKPKKRTGFMVRAPTPNRPTYLNSSLKTLSMQPKTSTYLSIWNCTLLEVYQCQIFFRL